MRLPWSASPRLVFDPFIGSATTDIGAEQHDRQLLSIETNPDIAKAARARLSAEARRRSTVTTEDSLAA